MFGRTNREYEDAHYARHRRSLSIRRLIGVGIILAFLWGVFWVFFLSGYADPLIAAVEPAFTTASAMINDPLGIDCGGRLIAIAAIAIPHIGLLMFIFDDSVR